MDFQNSGELPVLRHSDSRKFRVYGITEEFGIVDFGYVGDLDVLQFQDACLYWY